MLTYHFIAVEPGVAAKSLVEWVDKLDHSHSGKFFAPRGPEDIGTIEAMGKNPEDLTTPLELDW